MLSVGLWSMLGKAAVTWAAVSLAGPIGFVGIVVPHLVRLMVGVDHRVVLPASALFGAVLAIVQNGLGLLGFQAAQVNIITGLVLLIAATVDALSRRRASTR